MNRSLLKPHASLFLSLLRVGDPVTCIIVGLAGWYVYLRESFALPDQYITFLLGGALAVVAVFPIFRLYDPQRGASVTDEVRALMLAWCTIAALAGIAIFATKSGNTFSRIWVTSWVIGSFVMTTAMRMSVRIALRALRRRGYNLRHVAIVGAGALGRDMADRLHRAPWTGLNVVGFYDDDPHKQGMRITGLPVLGPTDQLVGDLSRTGVDQVWIALPLRAEERIRALLGMLRDAPVEVRFVPDIYGFHLLNHSFMEVAGLPVISLTETPMVGANRVLKLLEDLSFGVIALVLAAPALAVIALLIKLTSRGPVLYSQDRMTWNGERFRILKFRTMPVGVESDGPVWSDAISGRATRFGAFLRRFSLDELPQLINVIRGEMSLVGPRPERPEFVARFRQEIPGYMQKHLVKAGITGWAQVNDLRGDSDIAARLQYDLYYIDHWSLWFDLRILSLTLWHVLKSRRAR